MTSDKAYSAEARLSALITALAAVIPADSWHVLSLANGWTGNCSYRLMPGALVELEINLDSTTATATQFGTMPAGYVPSGTKYLAAGCTANLNATAAPLVQVLNTGAIAMLGLHAFSTAGTWGASGFYRL